MTRTPASVPHLVLNNGTKIPSVGLGCWMGTPGGAERVYEMCRKAITVGYRHFDTASGYANEKEVGKAIRDSGIPREEFYITTKLGWNHHLVPQSFDESLENLNCEYVDLYLMHWPQARIPGTSGEEDSVFLPPEASPTIIDTWKEMEKLLESGKVKSLGVSNFSIKTLSQLLPHCSITPAVNQVEMHLFLPQTELKAFCEEKGIMITAYSPLGKPASPDQAISIFNNDTVKGLASKLGADVGQLLLSWGVQRGTVVVPKTENEMRMKRNITLLTLSDEDMNVLDNVHREPGMHRTLFHIDPSRTGGMVLGWKYEQLGWNLVEGGVVPSNS